MASLTSKAASVSFGQRIWNALSAWTIRNSGYQRLGRYKFCNSSGRYLDVFASFGLSSKLGLARGYLLFLISRSTSWWSVQWRRATRGDRGHSETPWRWKTTSPVQNCKSYWSDHQTCYTTQRPVDQAWRGTLKLCGCCRGSVLPRYECLNSEWALHCVFRDTISPLTNLEL